MGIPTDPLCSTGPVICLKSLWILLRKNPIFLTRMERPDNEWQWIKSSLGCQTRLQSKIWYVHRNINSNKIYRQQLHYSHLSWCCQILKKYQKNQLFPKKSLTTRHNPTFKWELWTLKMCNWTQTIKILVEFYKKWEWMVLR